MRLLRHVHGLSIDFHLERKPGEIEGALSKSSEITRLLDLIVFTIIPVAFDLILVGNCDA